MFSNIEPIYWWTEASIPLSLASAQKIPSFNASLSSKSADKESEEISCADINIVFISSLLIPANANVNKAWSSKAENLPPTSSWIYKSPSQPFSLDVLLSSLFSAFLSVTAIKCFAADFFASSKDCPLAIYASSSIFCILKKPSLVSNVEPDFDAII